MTEYVFCAILVAYLVWLQVLDVDTTNEVIDLGGYEANPVMAWVMRWTGDYWWIPAKVIWVGGWLAVLIYLVWVGYWYLGLPALSGLVVLYLTVVDHNREVIKQRINRRVR